MVSLTTAAPKASPTARALSIAGSDSGGGAGIQADLKTFAAFGAYGMSVITAVTAQNTLGVQGVQALSADFVRLQFESVIGDLGADAVKTGMLGDAAVVRAVAGMLAQAQIQRLLVDPVMVAKSGDHLLAVDALDALRDELLPLALVLTPNLPEAEVLLGERIRTLADMEQAVQRLHALGPRWIVLKGGHAEGETVTDLLFDGQTIWRLDSPRIPTAHTHGTGCTFSAAMTAAVAAGAEVPQAFELAKRYTHAAIAHNPGLGGGHGPLNHLVTGWR